MTEGQKSKEQRELERLRREYPDLDIQLTPKEERSQHRIFIGRPPIARPRLRPASRPEGEGDARR